VHFEHNDAVRSPVPKMYSDPCFACFGSDPRSACRAATEAR